MGKRGAATWMHVTMTRVPWPSSQRVPGEFSDIFILTMSRDSPRLCVCGPARPPDSGDVGARAGKGAKGWRVREVPYRAEIVPSSIPSDAGGIVRYP